MQKYKNIEMEQMITALEPLLKRTDIIGYAAARNTRLLKNEVTEYMNRRNELVCKYGEPVKDENGAPTGAYQLKIYSANWKEYEAGIAEWALIEHECNLMTVKPEDVIGKLTGEEIFNIDWMIEKES